MLLLICRKPLFNIPAIREVSVVGGIEDTVLIFFKHRIPRKPSEKALL